MNVVQQALQNLRQRQQLLSLFIFTLVAIVVWIVVSVATSQRSSAISAELRAMAQPLTPSINRVVLEEVEAERYFTEQELGDFAVVRVVEPLESVPSPEPSVQPSPDAIASPEPSETPSVEPLPSDVPATSSATN